MNGIENHGIGLIEEVVIIISLFLVVIIEIVIFLGGANWQISDALIEETGLLDILLADGEEITKMEISSWVNAHGWKVFLNSQDRGDLIDILDTIGGTGEGIIQVSESAEVIICVSEKAHGLRSSLLDAEIRLEVDEIAKLEVGATRQKSSNFAVFSTNINEEKIFERLLIFDPDLTAADDIVDEAFEAVGLKMIDDGASISVTTREVRSSVDGLSSETFPKSHPHRIDGLVDSTGEDVPDAHGVGDQTSLLRFILGFRFEGSLIVGSNDG